MQNLPPVNNRRRHLHFPKSIAIDGREFGIVKKCNGRGGEFGWNGKRASIGISADAPDGKRFEYFMHEVMEAAAASMGYRYENLEVCGNDGFKFVMNHHEFNRYVCEIAGVLLQSGMLKGV